MSKELPYFRFFVSEWLTDQISFLPLRTKGIFIDVCSYYWFHDCNITKAMLKQRLGRSYKELDKLIENQIIKIDKKENISIKFLDKQYDMLSEKRRKRQEAGSKGGKASTKQNISNDKAMLKQSTSYKDKDKKENKYSPSEIEWMMGSPDGVRPKDHILVEDYIQLTGIPMEKINKALLYEFNDGTWIKYED